MLEEISKWFHHNWNLPVQIQENIFFSVVALFILTLVRVSVMTLVFKGTEDVKKRYYWRSGVKNAYFFLVIISLTFIWLDKIGSLATFLGLLTAGLAIALQDPIANLAGWAFIAVRGPFEVGDRIEIGGSSGDVIDLRLFQFTINEIGNWVESDQSTGRIIHIPNSQIFKLPLANFNQGFQHIWNEVYVQITFESNRKKAKQILTEIIKDHALNLNANAEKKLRESSKKYMIYYKVLTPIVYTSVKDSGVQFSLRYLCQPKRKRVTENNIWEDVLDAFDQHNDIDLAYPTTRIYYQPKEGK